jgi:tetratricopeptide (TPR) repeat protein
MRAWEAFRKGFDLVFPIKSSNAMAEGRQYLEQALEMDPEYLEARAWLAWSKIDRPEERVEESRRVLQRQRTNPVALYSLIEDSQSQWDFETAQLLWRYTVAKNPSDDQLTFVGFYLCACLGALEEALLVTRRGVRMDPLWPARHFFLGLAYLNLGDPDTAIEQIRRAIALGTRFHDNPSRTYHTLAVASQLAGREAEAIDWLLAGFPRFRSEIADGAERDGWHGANLALLDALGDVPEDHPNRLRRVRFKATVLASIGEQEEMYSELKELMDKTDEHPGRDRETLRNTQFIAMSLRASAEFRRYWSEPEFVTLRRQLDDRIARSAGVTGYADLIR